MVSKWQELSSAVDSGVYPSFSGVNSSQTNSEKDPLGPWNMGVNFLAGGFSYDTSNKKIIPSNARTEGEFKIKGIESIGGDKYTVRINVKPNSENFPELDYIFELGRVDEKLFSVNSQYIDWLSSGNLGMTIKSNSIPMFSTESYAKGGQEIEATMVRLLKYALCLELNIKKEDLKCVGSSGVLLTQKDLKINRDGQLFGREGKITSLKIDSPVRYSSTSNKEGTGYNLYYYPQYSDKKYKVFKLNGKFYRVFEENVQKIEKLYNGNWVFPLELRKQTSDENYSNNFIVKSSNDRENLQQTLLETSKKINLGQLLIDYRTYPNGDKNRAIGYLNSPNVAKRAADIINFK